MQQAPLVDALLAASACDLSSAVHLTSEISIAPSLQEPWESFQADVHDLFHEKLSRSPAQSIWRTYSPTHFGGATGTFTGIEEVLLS